MLTEAAGQGHLSHYSEVTTASYKLARALLRNTDEGFFFPKKSNTLPKDCLFTAPFSREVTNTTSALLSTKKDETTNHLSHFSKKKNKFN